MSTNEYLNCQQTVIHLQHFNIYLGAVYRAPESSTELFLEFLSNQLERFPNSVWIGDLNINLLAKHDLDNERIHKYKTMLASNSFKV